MHGLHFYDGGPRVRRPLHGNTIGQHVFTEDDPHGCTRGVLCEVVLGSEHRSCVDNV